MDPIRVLLADDHRLVRAGIPSLLERLLEIEIVGEASDGREALRLIGEHRPQIVLMDSVSETSPVWSAMQSRLASLILHKTTDCCLFGRFAVKIGLISLT